MIHSTPFTKDHIAAATAIAHANYNEERAAVSGLPPIDTLPDLTCFAENGLGVAMYDDTQMLGFLCCYEPWDHAFGSTARGTFSPIQAHGAIPANRAMIYKRLYQAAAEKWVEQGIAYHSICLFAHDTQAISSLFSYGFGLRCIDAVRPMTPFACVSCDGITFSELAQTDAAMVRDMRTMHSAHLGQSPCFMKSSPNDVKAWIDRAETRDSRLFVAFHAQKPIAYMEVMDDGENYATEDSGMKNICGAFCLPEFRSRGIAHTLLSCVVSKLQAEGYSSLGVDFEGFNPTASGFWLKHFTAYTNSVVRRIDECAL